jgi:hypothetical protein
MPKTQLFSKLRCHEIFEMTTIISNNRLGDTKPSNDVIKYEQCCSFPDVIKCRHLLDPFSEIIHSYNDASMPLG